MVKISKSVYFSDIKVNFLDTLDRPVELTDIVSNRVVYTLFLYKNNYIRTSSLKFSGNFLQNQ